MCGIAGLIGDNKEKNFLTDQIKIMLNSLSHRGPDYEDFFIDQQKGMAIGHRRLSILDLSENGSQPMFSFDGNFLLSFNGEIYNHLDLRNDLKRDFKFNQWKSTSDTESLVNYISFYGLNKTLDKVDGMFAFFLYDIKNKKVYLVRDIFGEKPLYYAWQNNTFFFASELKSIANTKNFKKNINNKGLSSLLEYSYIAAPYSIFNDIYKLKPGELAEISLENDFKSSNLLKSKKFNLKKWFSISDKFTNNKNEKNEYNFKLELENTIKSRLISDANLGCFLSGGIDSSIIASVISNYNKNKYETFTIGFENSQYDESSKAEKIAKYLGLKNNKLILNEGLMREIVPKINDIYDEPFADSSQIPTYLLCNFASQFSKVSLSGDGGDELFGGYNRYFYTEKIWKKIKMIPQPLRSYFFKLILHTPNTLFFFIQFLVNTLFFTQKLNLFSEKIKKLSYKIVRSKNKKELYLSFLKEWDTSEIQIIPETLNYNQQFETIASDKKNFAENMMLFDMQTYLPNDILTKVDRASMANGLEVRAPFLSKQLLKISNSLPIENKIHGNKGKIILREVLKNYLPDELVNLPKQGFGIPLGEWINSTLNDWIYDNIETVKRKKQSYINTNQLMKNIEIHKQGKINLSSKLWPAIIFCDWFNKNF